MKVKIWGCRGSIPAPGRETLIFGGESTCVEIISDSGESLIVDAGSGIRRLGNKIMKENGSKNLTILLTHAHWDHLAGFPFFKPAYSPEYSISFCGGPVPQESIMKYFTHQMEQPYFSVDISEMKAEFKAGCHCDQNLCDHCPGELKSIACASIPINHPNGGYAFKFKSNEKVICFFPDNELGYAHEGGLTINEYADFCRGANLLIHDAQYTEEQYKKTKGWGHSTFKDTVDLALAAGVRNLGLFHHDPDRTDDDLQQQADFCKKYISETGGKLNCFACADGMLLKI